ncbi:MAG: transcription initiation factor IIB family protein [Candidatus Hodarchaeota archaeon]
MASDAVKTKVVKDKKDKIACPECFNETNIISDYSTGDQICGECGLVITEKIIDQGPEWRAFNVTERDKRARTGSPISMTVFDKGLSTMIDSHDKDYYGNKIKPKKRAQIYRMRKWDNRTRIHDAIAKNLSKAMSELDRLSSQLEIPKDIKQEAAFLYRKALDSGKIKGRNIAGMMTAALYAACRLRNMPRTFDDFQKFSKLSKKSLRKFYRIFVETMNIKVPLADPKSYVPRFCASLKLSNHVQNKVYEILTDIKGKNISSGRDPTKLTAAAIYIAGILEGEKRTQKEIARVANISEVTLRNRYKEIAKILKIRLEF